MRIVITGATSGIGRALALHVAREYDRMLLIGRSEERGQIRPATAEERVERQKEAV